MSKLTKYEVRRNIQTCNAYIIGQPKQEHTEFVRSVLVKLDKERI